MATDRALMSRFRVMAAKVETTTGTAISLSATDGQFNVMDMAVSAEIPPTEREGQGSLTDLPPVPGARMGKLTFKHEVFGKGASGDPGWLSTLVGSCGFAVNTGVWYPISPSIQTSSFGAYIDGRFFSISGAMGKVTFDFEAGKPVMGSYEFNGVWNAPSDVAIIAPTYPTVIPPRFAAATLTIGGTQYRIGKAQLILDNTLYMRQDVSHVSGYHSCAIVKRRYTLKVSPEAVALATKDWYAAHLAGTTFALNLVVGGTANNIITFTAPRLALINAPQNEDDSGIYRDGLEFLCTSATQDAEITIAAS